MREPRIARYRIPHVFPVTAIILTAMMFVGCAGPLGAPTTQSTPPTGTPPVTGWGSNSTPSADFYLASIFPVVDSGFDEPQTLNTDPKGTIRVNETASDGRGTIKMNGGEPSTTYQLRFCQRGAPRAFTSCVSVTDYATDGNGAASVNFQMAKGGYSGAFYIFKDNAVRFAGGFNTAIAEVSFATGMAPGVDIRGNTPGRARGDVTGRRARVTVTSGPPNETFRCHLLNITRGGGDLGLLTTDAQGNGSNDPTVFEQFNSHPKAGTGTFYCSAKCETGQCQYTYGTGFKVD